MGASSKSPGEVTTADVTATKQVNTSSFPHPVIEVEITSNRADPVYIEYAESVPTGASVESVGFHPDYEADQWSVDAEADALSYTGELPPEQTITTLYAVKPDAEASPEEFEAVDPTVTVDPVSAETTSQDAVQSAPASDASSAQDNSSSDVAPTPSADTPDETGTKDDRSSETGSDDQSENPEEGDSQQRSNDVETLPEAPVSSEDGPEASPSAVPAERDEETTIELDLSEAESDAEAESSEEDSSDKSTMEESPEETGDPIEDTDSTDSPVTDQSVSDDDDDPLAPASASEAESDTTEPDGADRGASGSPVDSPMASESRTEAAEATSPDEADESTPDAGQEATTEAEAADDEQTVTEQLIDELQSGAVSEREVAALRQHLGMATGKSVEARLKHVQRELVDVAAYQAEMEELITNRGPDDEFLPELHERVDDMDETVEAVRADMDAVKDQLAALEEQLDALSDNVSEIDSRVHTLEDETLPAAADDREALEETLGDLEDDLEETRSRVAALREWREQMADVLQ